MRLVALAELLRGAEQPRSQEVEERPEIPEAVLHRRAREGEARAPAERLDRARLLGAGVLDGLRLVEHDEAPLALEQPRDARRATP